MKEKIVVVGIGELFWQIKDSIEENFEIVALADNITKSSKIGNYIKISIQEVASQNCDKILICARAHKELLRETLVSSGIGEDKIIDADDYEKILYQNDKKRYEKDKVSYIEKFNTNGKGNFAYNQDDEYAFLADYRSNAGRVDGHYFYMDILVAKKIGENRPGKHFDIGSRVDGLISHLLAMDIDTTLIDIRPLPIQNAGCGMAKLDFIQGDATNLEDIKDNSIESISSLHAIEHFGLGRYGDEVDPNACFKAMASMSRVLAPGGYVYFAVPVGKREKVCFNAHRVFSPQTVVQGFSQLHLDKMYLIHDMILTEYSCDEVRNENYSSLIGAYDCGIFIFTK